MKHQFDCSSFDYLKSTVNALMPDLPEHVFQPNASRLESETFLRHYVNIPFVLRTSSINGYFAMDYLVHNRPGLCFHILIKPPANKETDFTLWCLDINQFKQVNKSLKFKLDEIYKGNLSFLRQSGKKLRQRWEQFITEQAKLTPKRAVLSLQSLDNKKVAFTAEEVVQYSDRYKKSLQSPGDGHTGLTMALVLKDSPFVVIRSKGKRDDSSRSLANHIGHNGLIVITGHSSADEGVISGAYKNQDDELKFSNQILRGAEDISSFSQESGLRKGDHVVILLCICYGAKSIHLYQSSFAQKLAIVLANDGINSTIIATDNVFCRFGMDVIKDGQIEFNESVGMQPDSVNVLFTDGESGQIQIIKPHERIYLDQNGLKFIKPMSGVFMENHPENSQSHGAMTSFAQEPVDTMTLNSIQSTNKEPSPLASLSILGLKREIQKHKYPVKTEAIGQIGLDFISGAQRITVAKKRLLRFQKASKTGISGVDKSVSRFLRAIRCDRSKFASLFQHIEDMGLHADLLIRTSPGMGGHVKLLPSTYQDRLTNFLLFCRYHSMSQFLLQQFNSDLLAIQKSSAHDTSEYGNDWNRIIKKSLLALTGLCVLIILVFGSLWNNTSPQDHAITGLDQLFFSSQFNSLQSMDPAEVLTNDQRHLPCL